MFRRIQTHGRIKAWYSEGFRSAYHKIQALAFMPVNNVITAFKHIKAYFPHSFYFICDYFENNYIGVYLNNDYIAKLLINIIKVLLKGKFDEDKEMRKILLFPKEVWNVHERIKDDLPHTNNNVVLASNYSGRCPKTFVTRKRFNKY